MTSIERSNKGGRKVPYHIEIDTNWEKRIQITKEALVSSDLDLGEFIDSIAAHMDSDEKLDLDVVKLLSTKQGLIERLYYSLYCSDSSLIEPLRNNNKINWDIVIGIVCLSFFEDEEEIEMIDVEEIKEKLKMVSEVKRAKESLKSIKKILKKEDMNKLRRAALDLVNGSPES